MKGEFWFGVRGFLTMAAIIVAIWASYFFVVPSYFLEGTGRTFSELDPGVAGDMFGSLTALFSGLAFAGLLSTLLMQRRELELQRKELSETTKQFYLQRFENTFFGLNSLFNEYIDAMKGVSGYYEFDPGQPVEQLSGRKLMQSYQAYLTPRMTYVEPAMYGVPDTNREYDRNLSAFRDQLEVFKRDELGPYFRLMRDILRHIDLDAVLTKTDKVKYAEIFRSLLSGPEVVIILAYLNASQDKELLKLIRRYDICAEANPADKQKFPALFAILD